MLFHELDTGSEHLPDLVDELSTTKYPSSSNRNRSVSVRECSKQLASTVFLYQ